MNITFKSTRYEADPKLIEETRKRLEALGRFLGKDAHTAIASVELEQAVGKQKQGDIWRAEINVDHEGTHYRAESTKAKLDHAVTTVLRDIAGEFRRARKKDQHLFKRGGAAVKDFLRGFGGT